jgi:hypothetical protein
MSSGKPEESQQTKETKRKIAIDTLLIGSTAPTPATATKHNISANARKGTQHL